MIDRRKLFQLAYSEIRRAKTVGLLNTEDLVQDAHLALCSHKTECQLAEEQEHLKVAQRIMQRHIKRARTNLDIGVGSVTARHDPIDERDDEGDTLEHEIKSAQIDQMRHEMNRLLNSDDDEEQAMGQAVQLAYFPRKGQKPIRKHLLASALGVDEGRAAYLVKSGIEAIRAAINPRFKLVKNELTGEVDKILIFPKKYKPRRQIEDDGASLFDHPCVQGTLVEV